MSSFEQWQQRQMLPWPGPTPNSPYQAINQETEICTATSDSANQAAGQDRAEIPSPTFHQPVLYYPDSPSQNYIDPASRYQRDGMMPNYTWRRETQFPYRTQRTELLASTSPPTSSEPHTDSLMGNPVSPGSFLGPQVATVRSQGIPMSTRGGLEVFDPSYKLQSHKFFHVGRVFSVLWCEPAGQSGTVLSTTTPSDLTNMSRHSAARSGNGIYSKVRRFVVVRESHNYLSALPINTYGSLGVGKTGVIKSEHAVIYTGTQAPTPLKSEQPRGNELAMKPTAIRVVPDSRTDKLDPMSRIHFGKVYTIEHNIKVKPFGLIHNDSKDPLLVQFLSVFAGRKSFGDNLFVDKDSIPRPSLSPQRARSTPFATVQRNISGSSSVNRGAGHCGEDEDEDSEEDEENSSNEDE